MRKTVLIYGCLAGALVLALWFGSMRFWISPDGKMDMSKGEIWGYTNMIVSLSLVFFGVRHYRDKHLEGKINFGKALWVGFQIALVAAIIYMLGWMVYYNTNEFAHQFPVQYMEHMKKEWAESGMSAEDLARKTAAFEKNMEMYDNPFFMAIMTIFEILPVGLIVALISAFILKKK